MELTLTCAGCAAAPNLTINGQALCSRCAHAAIDRATPAPRPARLAPPLLPLEVRRRIGEEITAEYRAFKAGGPRPEWLSWKPGYPVEATP